MPPMPRLHIELPDNLHRRAKAAAAMQGVTLKEFVTTAIDLALEAQEVDPSAERNG